MKSTLICVLAALGLAIDNGGATLLVSRFAISGPRSARAADHQDSVLVAPVTDPTLDLGDLFVWPSKDGSRVQLVLTMAPVATQSTRFSQAVVYALHTTALARYGDAAPARTTDILCSFDQDQRVSCWVGNQDYVSGDASQEAGLRSHSGRILVFTGVRSDPFFYNQSGFAVVTDNVHAVLAGPPSATAKCPSVPAATSQRWLTQLRTAPDGSAARDYMLNNNLLALVLSIDRALLVPAGAPILSVWASAHKVSP